MRFLDLLTTANRNLTRSPLRTLLTILAIFVGGFTLTLTTALNTGATEYLDRQLGNVSVPGVFQVVPKADINPLQSEGVQEYDPNKKINSVANILTASFTQQDVDKLAKVEGVSSAQPLYNIAGEYVTRGGKKYQVSQIVQDVSLNLDLSAGRLLRQTDKDSIILTEEYATALGFAQDEAVGKKIRLGYGDIQRGNVERELAVVGVMKKSFLTSNQLYISFDVAERVAKSQGQTAKFFGGLVRFKDVTDKTDESVLKKRLQASGNYTAMSMKERIGTVITVVTAITTGLNVVGIIALLAASFGIINTLLMSVYERTKEIGLMKALGMRRRTVFSIFALEAVLVGFWGSVVACAIAYTASLAINSYATATFLKDFEGFMLLAVTPWNVLFVMALIMLIAFVAGTLPALKASRLDPIEALRTE